MGLSANKITGNIKNSGVISVKATGVSDATATGISVATTLKGNFTNKGTLKVSAFDGSSDADALGFKAGKMTGNIKNSGKITVFASGSNGTTATASANATGIAISTAPLVGNFTNKGTLKVSAIAGTALASAFGFFAGTGGVTGNIVNSGKITVLASATTTAQATGILVYGTVVGNITNASALKVTALAGTSTAQAGGIVIRANTTGSFKNSGRITVKATGQRITGTLGATNAGAAGFAVAGTLVGNITNTGALQVTATATNAQSFTNDTIRGITVNVMTGTIKNTGRITVVGRGRGEATASNTISAVGIHLNSLSGNFTNKGTLKVSVTGSTGYDASDGSLTAKGFVVANTMTGTVLNKGLISVKAISQGTSGDDANATAISIGKLVGNLTNKGTIKVVAASTDETGDAQGISITTMTGLFKNSGKITVNATGATNRSGDATGIDFGTLKAIATTAFPNAAGAKLKVLATASIGDAFAMGLSASNVTGNIKNSGRISVKAAGVTGATATGISVNTTLTGNFTNKGTLKVSAFDGTASADAQGFRANKVTAGNIKNSGRITVLASGSNGATGTADASATGISINTLVGNFTNAGTLKVSALAGTSTGRARGFRANTVTGTISNAGSIAVKATGSYATATGIRVFNALSGSFTNAGTLKVTATANTISAAARGFFASAVTGNVKNSGQISVKAIAASTGRATGIRVTAMNGSITNSGNIKVTASGSNVSARGIVVFGNLAGSIVNAGTIKVAGTTTGGSTVGTGIRVQGSVTGAITNSGLISAPQGIVAAGNFANSVINSGTIRAGATTRNAIALGSGNDTVTIAGGKITGVIDGQANTDTLNFKLGGVFSQNGVIKGFEAINVSTGTAILNNNVTNTAAGIAMVVNDGARLEIGASLSLAGNTSNGSLTVGTAGATQAVLDLNNNTFTVNGNVSVTAGAKIVAQITGTTGVAGGNVTATGGSLNVASGADLGLEVNANGFVSNGAVFTIAKGTAGTVATLGAITDDSFVLAFAQTGTGNSTLQVVATRENSLIDGALSGNGGVLAGILEALGASGDANADQLLILGALDSLPDQAAVDEALTDLTPDTGGGAVSGAAGAANAGGLQIGGRFVALQLAMANGSGIAAGDHTPDGGVWGQFYGNFADADQRGGINGYDADTFGVIVGADFTPFSGNENFRLGGALSYADTDVDAQDARVGDETEIDSWSPYLYGTYATGKWFVDGRLAAAFSDYDSTRRIAFLGATANGDFDGEQYSADLTFGYNIPIGEKAFLIPIAGISYWHMDIDGFTETGAGAGAANLVVADQDYDYFAPMIGARVVGTAGTQGDWTLQPNASATVKHDFIDDAVAVTAGLVGTASANFAGYDPADTVINLGLGLTMFNSEGVTVDVGYNADLASDLTSHNALRTVRYEF